MTIGFSDQVTRLFGSQQPLLAAGRNLPARARPAATGQKLVRSPGHGPGHPPDRQGQA